MENTPSLEDLYAQYLAHHRAYGRSTSTISHYEDTFKVFTRFLAVTDIATDRRSLSAATFRHFATWLRSTPLHRQRPPQPVAGALA